MFFFLSAKGAAKWFSRSAKVHWLSHIDWCLREGHDSWIQDRPGPGCHFKQSDHGEKPCLMASLPQSLMLVILEGLRKKLKVSRVDCSSLWGLWQFVGEYDSTEIYNPTWQVQFQLVILAYRFADDYQTPICKLDTVFWTLRFMKGGVFWGSPHNHRFVLNGRLIH